MSKKKALIYEDDNDAIVHQIAKLALTTIGGWLTVKLIETAYNAYFGLNDKEEDFNA